MNIFDTYYMLAAVNELPPEHTFFKRRYFPTNTAMDIFGTSKVLADYKDNKQRRRRPDGSYIDERDENSDEYDDEFDDGYGEMDQFGPGSYNGVRNIGNSRNNSVGGFSRNNRF